MDQRLASNRLEQRTLQLSLACVATIALGSLAWGLAIESDVVILNGVFSLVSLIGSILYLTAARLVARPADRRFQYGYAHVEPMANGVEGLRAGGSEVDAAGVVWFGALTGIVSLAIGSHEIRMGRRIGSQLLRNDGREWLMDAAFSLVTLAGFALLFVLPEPLRGLWARYADSALVVLLALLFLPVPVGVLRQNLREMLHMADEDEAISKRVEAAMQSVRAEQDIRSHTTHVAKVGRQHFVEVNVLVGPDFGAKSVPQLDELREHIWRAVGRPVDSSWVTITFTADPRWA
jgi:predicted Co/Zn/Cd cation transporter (cation efflux family)